MENFLTIEPELLITLDAVNASCNKTKEEVACQQLLGNLWIQAKVFEDTTKNVQKIYIHEECKNRSKRT